MLALLETTGRTTIVGKKLVVILGQKKAVAIAVGNVSGQRRWSKLPEWLMKNRLVRSAFQVRKRMAE